MRPSDAQPLQVLALVKAERASLSDPGPARERLRSRLAPLFEVSAVVGAAGGAAGVGSANPLPGRTLLGWPLRPLLGTLFGLATGFVLGVGVARAPTVRPAAAAPSATALARSPTSTAVAQRMIREVVTVDAPVRSAPQAVAFSNAASLPPKRPANTGDANLARERQLIEQGRTALARGDAAAALLAFEAHERGFPRGQLTELREAMLIHTLAALGRSTEAETHRVAFRSRYPDSMYAGLVE